MEREIREKSIGQRGQRIDREMRDKIRREKLNAEEKLEMDLDFGV